MSRGFGYVLAVVAALLASGIGAWLLGHYEAGAILLSLACGLGLAVVVLERLMPIAVKADAADLLRDRRILADRVGEEMMLAAGACAHVKGSAAPRCDCALGSRW